MSDLTFINSDYLIPVLVGAIVLFVVFLIKEWPRKNGGGFIIRILIGLVAILVLLAISLKPAHLTAVEGKQGVLLTLGYQEKKLDSLKKLNPQLTELAYNGPILQSQIDSLNKIIVLGNGVQPYDFWQLGDKNIEFLEGEIPAGIDKINFKTSAVEGEDWSVKARYSKPKIGNQIVLQAPGNLPLDSVQFDEIQNTVFLLQAKLKTPGNFVYELVEKDSTGIEIKREPLPLRVQPDQQLSIVMLNAFPTFEIKYLKNFLAELNHQILVRSRLTQRRYKYEYFNRERQTFQSLTAATLESIAFQTKDLIGAMKNDGASFSELRVDGGMVANNWFSQQLSNVLGLTVLRPRVIETTALGANYLASLNSRLCPDLDSLKSNWSCDKTFEPEEKKVALLNTKYETWLSAVDRTKGLF